MAERVMLGHIYRDLVTGLRGIAISRHLYVFGCERVTLQYTTHDGNIRDETFDISSLVYVAPGPKDLVEKLNSSRQRDRHSNPYRSIDLLS